MPIIIYSTRKGENRKMLTNKKFYIKLTIVLSTIIAMGVIILPTNSFISLPLDQTIVTSNPKLSEQIYAQTKTQKEKPSHTDKTTPNKAIEKILTKKSYPTVDIAATFTEHGRPIIYTNIPKTKLAQKKAELEKAGARVVASERNIPLAYVDEISDPLTNTIDDNHLRITKNKLAFPISKGKGVTVAVIDSGITPGADSGKIVGAVDLVGTGLGPDGVPDGSSDTTDTIKPAPANQGYIGHGTSVAGLINEVYGNRLLIYGGAPEAGILNVKVFGRNEKTTSPALIVQGIYYAVDHGANIINLSLTLSGWTDSEDKQLFEDAFAYAHKKNVVIAIAMGNNNTDLSDTKQRLDAPNIIWVTATKEGYNYPQEEDPRKTVKADYSTYGSMTDLAAPGYQAVLNPTRPGNDPNYVQTQMAPGAGTSFAAPQVAAVFALLKSKYPNWTVEQLKQRIFSTADDIGPIGKDIYFGYGRINAARALGGLGQPSPAPTNIIAKAKEYDEENDINSDGSVNVSWTPPPKINGVAQPHTYTVKSSPAGSTCTTANNTCDLFNLDPYKNYTFSVTAYNYAGTNGPSVESNTVFRQIPPSLAPINVQATAGNTSAKITWQMPAYKGGPLTRYRIKWIETSNYGYSVATDIGPVNGILPTSYTVTHLQNNKNYIFSVRAYNIAGHSPESTYSTPITPITQPPPSLVYPPSTPLNIQATSTGDNKVRVSWTPPTSNGGDNLISYIVTTHLNDATCNAIQTQTSCELTNLKPGQAYIFRVTAHNSAGNGPNGISSYFTVPLPAIPLVPPTNITAKNGNMSATVSWTPPTPQLSGTSYIVTSSPGDYTCVSTTTQCTILGLSNGISYVFTVKTKYQNSISPSSNKSNPIIPTTPVVVKSVTGIKILKYISATEAKIGWNNNTGSTLYSLRLSANNSSTQFGTWTYSKIPSNTLRGLIPGGNYKVQVRSSVGTSISPITTYAFKQATTTSAVRAPSSIFPKKGTVTIKWIPPLNNGGTPITSYHVRISAPNTAKTYMPWDTTVIPQFSYSGKVKGQRYYVQIFAHNSIGNSTITTYTFIQKT